LSSISTKSYRFNLYKFFKEKCEITFLFLGDNDYVKGKRVVVLGRSKIVGAPAAALFTWLILKNEIV
jgi:5,10-methylene-tetrahydrofolate dehydrogenase/methenyl tetrahydrofolate cyclohydrolase